MSASTRLDVSPPGTPFPEGRYRIETWAQALLCDRLGSSAPTDGSAHPLFAYLATQAGIGIDIDGILECAGCRAEDGPMMASCDIEFHAPLRVGATYRVTGQVLGTERKSGRTMGAFDLFSYELSLHDDARTAVAARVTNVLVIPRRNDESE